MGIFQHFKDCLFPYFCAACGKEGEWWCKTCRGVINPFTIGAASPGRPFGHSGGLEKATALFSYRGNPAVEKLIRDFKYEYVRDINDLWEEILKESRLVFSDDAVFIPVPLHDKRLRERGFNQAEELSQILSGIYQLPQLTQSLQRVRATAQQAKMAREERLKNVSGAFGWVGKIKAPRRAVLVDDVFTTGATIEECAKVLRSHGTEYIEALVLAHG